MAGVVFVHERIGYNNETARMLATPGAASDRSRVCTTGGLMPKSTLSPRKSTGKRLRFEVFKRDHFTCQYCGMQPPDVVLVIDHVTPVSAGGQTTIDNLVSACETCNQGKSNIPLNVSGVRPDADLLYLETQQEIAEMQRYQEALDHRERAVSSLVTRLQSLWCDSSSLDWHPSDLIIRQLLSRYEPFVVGEAILDVAPKVAGGYIQTHPNQKWVAYLNAVARNIAAEDQ